MEEFEITLEPRLDDEDLGQVGEFRNQNKAGEKYRRTLIDTPKISLKIALLGHGQLRMGGEEASLLIFDFRLTPSTITRRFKSASFQIIFRDTQGDQLADPEVYRIAPEGTFTINPWSLSTSVKNKFELGGNIGLPQGGLNASFGRETDQVHAVESSVTLTGRSKLLNKDGGEPNAIRWEMEEDPKKKLGTPTFLRTAVILIRPKGGRPFSFSMEGEADTKLKLGGKLKTISFLGRTGSEREQVPIADVEINPKLDVLKAQDRILSIYEEKINWKKMHELNLRGDLVQHAMREELGERVVGPIENENEKEEEVPKEK